MPASVMKMPQATRAAALYAAGMSEPQVAEAVGHTRKAVRTALRQLGIPRRTPAHGYRTWLELRGGIGNRKPAPEVLTARPSSL